MSTRAKCGIASSRRLRPRPVTKTRPVFSNQARTRSNRAIRVWRRTAAGRAHQGFVTGSTTASSNRLRCRHLRPASRFYSQARGVEKLRPPHRRLRPTLGPNPARPSRCGRAVLLWRVTRVRGRGERDAATQAALNSGRAGSAADAMRSTPPQRAAGKRARRLAPQRGCRAGGPRRGRGDFGPCDPRSSQRPDRRIGAPDMCRPHAPVVAAGATEYEPRAISRRVERRRRPTPLGRCSFPDVTR
jgi:hypothetical protein